MRLAMMTLIVTFGVLAVGTGHAEKEKKKMDNRVFEMRTYYAPPGKMKALHARFREHTRALFEKHGITIIGFWSPIDAKEAAAADALFADRKPKAP